MKMSILFMVFSQKKFNKFKCFTTHLDKKKKNNKKTKTKSNERCT